MDNIEILTKKLSEIEDKYDKYSQYEELVPKQYISGLKKLSNEFKIKIENAKNKNRIFKLGIVGQVKAGKSSFINALIFNGRDILPKAATPMTAALTKISYSKEQKAIVEFYSTEDWNIIKEKALEFDEYIDAEYNRQMKRYEERKNTINLGKSQNRNKPTKENIKKSMWSSIPEDVKAAKELVEMFKKSELNSEELFGNEKEIIINENDDFAKQLEDYVGANGKYTCLVKSTYLYMNEEALKGIEIVDTPGTNDPILSRGMRTKEFLAQCDFVILMSYSGQFMDSSDVGYLIEKLPNEGIRNVLLVGSKFDTVLLDQSHKHKGKLGLGLKIERDKLEKQASSILLPLLEKDKSNKKLLNIKKSLPPKFVSSMAYQISKNWNNLNAEQNNILNNLKKDYPTFTFNEKNMNELGRIEEIRINDFKKIKNEKDEIMRTKLNDTISGQIDKTKNILLELKEYIQNRVNEVAGSNKDKLKKKYEIMSNEMEKSSKEIELIFNSVVNNMKSNFFKFKTKLEKDSIAYKKIDIKSDSYEENYTVGTSKWYNPFSWGSSETKYNTISYNYADVYEAIEKVQEFVIKSQENITKEVEKIFDQQQLKDELKKAVLNAFDTENEYFDERAIIIPVEMALRDIVVPNISFNSKKYKKKITSGFSSGTVKDSEAEELRQTQIDIIDEILDDIQIIIDEKGKKTISDFERIEKSFVGSIKIKIKEQLDALQIIISEKERFENIANQIFAEIDNDIEKF